MSKPSGAFGAEMPTPSGLCKGGRVSSYLLRVQLEDRPGSLGSLAVALGSVGADILSLDVIERGSGYAVDDLVIDLPAGAMPDMLITAAEALTGVRVEAIRPHTGLLEAHRELELIDRVAAAGDHHEKLQVLVDEAPRVLRVGWCTVVGFADNQAYRIAGHDPRDSTSLDVAIPDVVGAAKAGSVGDLTGVRIGVVKQLRSGEGFQPGVLASFNAAVEALTALGAEVSEVDCPHLDYSLSAYYLILPSEVSSNLARFDAMRYGLRVGDDGSRSAEEVMALTRAAGFGPEVKRRIMIGTYALSAGYYDAYYNQAQKVRTLIARDLDEAYAKVDVLVSPATPTTAFRLGEKVDDPLAMYLFDLCTLPLNLAGHCGMSVPSGLSVDDDLPVGLQIMAPAMADDRLYRVGAAYEAARGPLPSAVRIGL